MESEIKLNEEILEDIIYDIKDKPTVHIEMFNMLTVQDNIEILKKSIELLNSNDDREIRSMAYTIYEITERRINNMLANPVVNCSLQKRKYLSSLLETLLDCNPRINKSKDKEKTNKYVKTKRRNKKK